MMQDEELERTLVQLQQQAAPGLPSNMSSRVWRSIQQREERAVPHFFAWPLWLAQPVMALLFLALTMGFGFVYGANFENNNKQEELAWADAFDVNSLYLPMPGSHH